MAGVTANLLRRLRGAGYRPRSWLKALLQRTGLLEPARRWSQRCVDGLVAVLLAALRPFLTVVLGRRKRTVRRSLWTGTPIITLSVCARAEQGLGIAADSLVFTTYFTTSDFTYNLARWNRGPALWTDVLLPVAVLAWACLRYQRFHFFCDRGFVPTRGFQFNLHELQLLRALGKEVFLYAYGADVRTRRRTEALGRPNCCTECPSPGTACLCDDERANRHWPELARLATATFSMGDMIHYTPGSRNDLYYWPIDLDRDGGRRYRPCYPEAQSSQPLRVVHAPNHRGFKGTHYLLEAVERLQRDGVAVELVLVERVPNEQALEIYRSADVIFDQCLIGFHGYFALEALAIGKPVMVFIRDPANSLADPHACPFINTPVERVEANLREQVQQRARLSELGKQGRRYIEKYHSLPAFARRLALTYQDLNRDAMEADASRRSAA